MWTRTTLPSPWVTSSGSLLSPTARSPAAPLQQDRYVTSKHLSSPWLQLQKYPDKCSFCEPYQVTWSVKYFTTEKLLDVGNSDTKTTLLGNVAKLATLLLVTLLLPNTGNDYVNSWFSEICRGGWSSLWNPWRCSRKTLRRSSSCFQKLVTYGLVRLGQGKKKKVRKKMD